MLTFPETNAGYFDGADVPEEFDPFELDKLLLMDIFGYLPEGF